MNYEKSENSYIFWGQDLKEYELRGLLKKVAVPAKIKLSLQGTLLPSTTSPLTLPSLPLQVWTLRDSEIVLNCLAEMEPLQNILAVIEYNKHLNAGEIHRLKWTFKAILKRKKSPKRSLRRSCVEQKTHTLWVKVGGSVDRVIRCRLCSRAN